MSNIDLSIAWLHFPREGELPNEKNVDACQENEKTCNYYFLHESNDSDWKMIARFSTPYEKSLQVNFISLWKIQNGVYK